jgi:hypothetical protein
MSISFESGTLINADGADKNKNQRNLRHLRPFLCMVVRPGAFGLFPFVCLSGTQESLAEIIVPMF